MSIELCKFHRMEEKRIQTVLNNRHYFADPNTFEENDLFRNGVKYGAFLTGRQGQKAANITKIYCMSKSNSPKHWAEYADNGNGFCAIYDFDMSKFTEPLRKYGIFDMLYIPESSDPLIQQQFHIDSWQKYPPKEIDSIFVIKHPQFKWENEVRFITRSVIAREMYIQCLTLKKIVFGWNVSIDKMSEIKSLFKCHRFDIEYDIEPISKIGVQS